MTPSSTSSAPAWKQVVDHFEEAVCAVLMLVMAVLAFANVALRYLSDYSFAFTEELEVSFLVFLTLFGAAAAFRRGLHLGLVAIQNRFPPAMKRALLIFSTLLTIVTFAVLIYYSLVQIQDERELNTLSEALEVPQWIYTLAIPLGSVCIIARVVQRAVEAWKELNTESRRSR